jgi:hypothetical protein
MSTVVPLRNNITDFTPYEFTEFAVKHKGEPISLSRRPWLRRIYNSPVTINSEGEYRRKMLLIFGRQSEKSTTIGNTLISLANLNAYLRLLYVTASNPQMREFSDERLRAIIADSPVLMKMTGSEVIGGKETQNVQTKRWLNQSKIVLRSVYRSADRVRGIASDVLAIDELQDIFTDSLPVIEETLFHCEQPEGPISLYAGTPKTFDNPLEFYWSRFSTQNEWLTKCDKCNHWNLIEEASIGPVGLICKKCAGPINPADGNSQWVRMGKSGLPWEGFRLPQPVVPYAYYNHPEVFKRHWKGLIEKQKRYPRPRFLNEVMARSYDAGTKPVTLEEVRRCCLPDACTFVRPEEVTKKIAGAKCWAGVDWGTGDASYTILSIWTYDANGRFSMVFAKRYEGAESDPDHTWRDIVKMCRVFNVTRVGADWGFGFYTNNMLKKALGAEKVILYQHAGKQKEKVKWDKLGAKFTCHRTRVLQDVFTLIKKGPVSGGLIMPKWEISETFANDILAVYSEYSELRREIVFDHPRGSPDDFLHTVCYALLVSQFDHRRPDLHLPGTMAAGRKRGR